jgi:PKD repeat protein
MSRIPIALGLLFAGLAGSALATEMQMSASGTPVALVTVPLGGGNYDINVIRDGVMPDTDIGENVGDSLQQYDTYDGTSATSLDEDWIGYHFDCTYDFSRVVFQEGKHFGNGGWFDPPETMVVQVEDPSTGEWTEAAGTWDPPYQGHLTDLQIVEFETFTWVPDAPVSGTGIRVYGRPGGGITDAFISCAELEVYAEIAGTPPVISLSYGPSGGKPPLEVTFDASGSQGEGLTYDWDFGDGNFASGSQLNHTFELAGNYRVKLTITSVIGGCTLTAVKTVDVSVGSGLAALGHPIALVTAPLGGGTRDINVIRDGIKPAVLIGENAGDSLQQYDSYDGANTSSNTEDWIGYEFDQAYDFAAVVFQEGKHFGNGGWFDPPEKLVVQYKDPDSGDWIEASGVWDPPYTGHFTNSQIAVFETFAWTGDEPVAGTGIRIYGPPGGGGVDPFISCAELEVFTPPEADVTRSADKETFALGDTILVTLDIAMRSGDAISIDEVVPSGATITDISDGGGQTGDAIHWDLAGIATTAVTYRIAPAACAAGVVFGASSWTAGYSRGTIGGTKTLTLAMAAGSLGVWTATDFAAPESGAAVIAAHEILIKGTGDGLQTQDDADGLRFVNRPARGDFEIAARIDCHDNPGGKGQAGVMVRDVFTESSAQAFLFLTEPVVAGSAGTIKGLIRKATATPAAKNTSVFMMATITDVTALPVWLRLRRGVREADGKTYIFFERSDDGVDYKELARKENIESILDLKADVFVGLGVAGGGDGTAASATFADVSGPEFIGGLEAPTGLQVVAGDGKLSLAWSAPTAGPAPEAYAVYRDGAFLVQVPATPTSYDDAAIESGMEYCYVVASRKGAEESARTGPACAHIDGGGPQFRRGDADGSGKLDLTDAIATLQFLYMGYAAPGCKDAADTDDSGKLDLTDAIASLQFQFMGGTPPAPPGSTTCGPDTTPTTEWNSADCQYACE